MKAKIFMGLAAAALMSVAACTNEMLEPTPSDPEAVRPIKTLSMTVKATFDDEDAQTKMVYTRADGMKWEEGDALRFRVYTWLESDSEWKWGMLDGNSLIWATVKPGSISDDGTTAEFELTFNVTGDEEYIRIFYMYPNFTFPGYQYYVEDGFRKMLVGGNKIVQLGQDEMSLELKNLSAYLSLNLSSEESIDLASIEIRAYEKECNDKTELITMSGTIASVDTGNGELEFLETGSYKNIYLFFGEKGTSITLDSNPKSFHIAVPAREYPNGFSIELTDLSGNKYYRRFFENHSVTLERNTIYDIPNLKLTAADFLSETFEIPDEAFRSDLLSNGYIAMASDGVNCSLTEKGRNLKSYRVPDGCTSLDGIKHFISLTELDLGGAKIAVLDVDGMYALNSLRWNDNLVSLNASQTGLSELNDWFHEPSLQYVDLSGCKRLKSVMGCQKALSANFSGCTKLESVDLGDAASLNSLNLSECPMIMELKLNGCTSLTEFPDVSAAKDTLGSVNISSCSFESVDLSGFVALSDFNVQKIKVKHLVLDGTRLSSFYLSDDYYNHSDGYRSGLESFSAKNCKSLKDIVIQAESLNELALSPSVESLEISLGKELTELDLSSLTALKRVELRGTGFSGLSVGDKPELTYFRISNPELKSLSFGDCPKLQYLSCEECDLETLDIAGCTNLVGLDCGSNWLESLDLPSSLECLHCSTNMLTGSLDLSSFSNLTELGCSSNLLESLVLPSSVYVLECSKNKLTELDITGCTGFFSKSDAYISCGNQRESLKLNLYMTASQYKYWLRGSMDTENPNVKVITQ